MNQARRFEFNVLGFQLIPHRELTKDQWLELSRLAWLACHKGDLTISDIKQRIDDAGMTDVFMDPT